MNAILRTPQIVPSLFARGADRDEPAPARAAPSRRFAADVWTCLKGDAVMAAACCVPALAASSLFVLILGAPLLRAASLAVGFGVRP